MSDTLTILGNVATDPVLSRTTTGIPVTNFRLATTHRRFDDSAQKWVDAGTNWYSIAAYRQLGEHAKASLRTGDRVIVTGRLKIRTWEGNGKQGTSVDIDADAIGHDLRWGTSAFLRTSRTTAGDSSARAADERAHAEEVDAAAAAGTRDGDDTQAELDTSWAISESEVETPSVVY